MAILADKDVEEILTPLLEVADEVTVSAVRYERRLPAEELRVLTKTLVPEVRVDTYAPLDFALEEVIPRCDPEDLVLVAGSLYAVGEALAFYRAKKRSVEQ